MASLLSQPYNTRRPLHEKVISSRIPTEELFDHETVERIRSVLMGAARRATRGDTDEFLAKPPLEQRARIAKFCRDVANKLQSIPHFLYNKIAFEATPVGNSQGLFGTASQHTFWTIIYVSINTETLPTVFVEAIEDKFDKEIIRLRSVLRHELAHRLHMEAIHRDPIKRVQSWRFQRAVTAAHDPYDYYGKPAEILAHANHTIELMAKGHDQGWREVVANYVLSDTSPGRVNTRQFIKLVSKLSREYDVPFTKRVMLRRELQQLAHQMHMKLPALTGSDIFQKRHILIQTGADPAQQLGASVRLIQRK